MRNVAVFSLARVSATSIGDVLSNDTSRARAEVSELQFKYGRLVAQVRSVTLDCDTCHSLTRKRDDHINSPQASLHTSNDDYKLLEGQIVFN